MSYLPDKYKVLAATIISAIMLWITFDVYNPAGAQPSTVFGAVTAFGVISTFLAFSDSSH